MFGMGFTEILFIAVIAILFLGPDKLPDAMVQIAKLFKSIRSTINEAKNSFEDEIHIKELREEALNYRKQFENASNDISSFKNSIPNPVSELQDAVSSIGGDRYLEDDVLVEIEEAEKKEVETVEDLDRKTTTTSKSKNKEDKSKKQSKRKNTKKSAPISPDNTNTKKKNLTRSKTKKKNSEDKV